MRGYLLDTCMIKYWFNNDDQCHAAVCAHIEGLPEEAPLRVSAVSVGEIEYGHRVAAREYTPVQEELNRFVNDKLPEVLVVRASTATYYGRIRARLFNTFAPKGQRKHLRPEQLVDPVTAKELGIQENDLWITAQAFEHNLVLVTHDKMDHIRQVLEGELTLAIEDWAS